MPTLLAAVDFIYTYLLRYPDWSRFAKMSLNPMRALGQLGLIYSWFVVILGTTSSHVFAQIVPDTTLPNNSIVTPNGTTFTIEGGTRAGGNLFHSFQDFSIPTNAEAFFNNAPAINNLITRVTGGQISNIDGLIRANGSANLFLLNPNGIIFGPNARLNIGGSFFASSASSLQFADGFEFSATNPQPTPLLTINVPIGLQLGANPGNLVVRSQGLQVLPSQTMGLIGGNLLLEGAQVRSPAGRIELWSAVNSGLSIVSNNGHLAIDSSSRTTQYGDIQLTQQAVLDASGVGGGTIQIQGRRVSIGEGSQVLTITQGSQPGGNLTVRGTESVEVSGANPSRFTVLSSDTAGAGTGGNLTVETGRFLLQGTAFLSASSFGQGAGGNLTVRASEQAVLVGTGFNSLQQFLGGVLSGQVGPSDSPRIGGLIAVTAGDGQGGHVSINTGSLLLQNGAIAFAPVFGRGNGGNLHIGANSVDAVGSGLIVGTSFGSQGNAGNLTITANQVTIRDGSILSGATFGSGHGGNIAIDASDFVDLSRTLPDALIPTGIANNSFGTGTGGNVRITTGRLTVREGAIIGVNSGGAIATGVIPFGGPGGDILLEARESIEFTGGAANNFAGRVGGVLTSGPGTTTFTAFPAGHLTIRTPRLTVADGAQISSASLSSGNGGHLTIEASDRVEVIGRSSLTGLPSAITSSSGRADVTNLSGMGNGGDLRPLCLQVLRAGGGQEI
jgi:filamentous hemagglutinin family protein